MPHARDLSKPRPACGDAAREPPGEVGVGVGRLAARMRVARDRPYVARAATGLRYPLPLDQTSLAQPFEMNPHAAGVQPEFRGELVGPQWSAGARQAGE